MHKSLERHLAYFTSFLFMEFVPRALQALVHCSSMKVFIFSSTSFVICSIPLYGQFHVLDIIRGKGGAVGVRCLLWKLWKKGVFRVLISISLGVFFEKRGREN